MAGVNKVILIGRLGKDIEVRDFANGGKVGNFTMATSETYKDRTTGERKEITDWHNVSARIPQQVDILQKYVKKGDMLYVEGKLRTRTWEKDGVTRYTTEVIIDSFTMLTPKSNGNTSQQQASAPAYEPAIAGDGTTDDLPF